MSKTNATDYIRIVIALCTLYFYEPLQDNVYLLGYILDVTCQLVDGESFLVLLFTRPFFLYIYIYIFFFHWFPSCRDRLTMRV